MRNGVVQLLSPITQLFAGDNGAQKRAIDGASTVDPNTTNAWSAIAANSDSTENIGRIWTDKSVFNDDYDFEGALADTSVEKGTDSDFLVSLSAISSTSNLKSVVTNITPLDIVLVLDVSGSMDDPIGEIETTTYQEVYDGRYTGLDTWRTYYVRSGNDYIAVTWEGNYYNGSWQDREGNEYEPRTSRNDNNRNHVQFYQQITASESAGSKMQALKDAANGFAETFATMNDSIADPNDRHRISIVKFASNENNSLGNGTYWDDYYDYQPNYTQVVSDLNSYTMENVSTLTNTINSLEGEGATQANYGFHQAQRVFDGDGSLTGARPDAQKVVIFFTDGNPTNYQNFSDSIAGQAINYAYDMKQAGALVYTIGVFEDANPSDTNSNFNRYMNAVSSNYPEAQCTNRRGQQSNDFGNLALGDKVQGEDGEEAPQYYYSATNAVGLEQVFKDITESLPINQGSGSPIEEVEGAAGTPGYLTFTDTLGSFMEVTGVGADNNKMYLAFADGLHEGTTSDGGKTWEFSGVVNEGQGVNTAYPEGADLSTITVTVTKSNNLATGDTITVQIPASLIPMRNYDVDTDNGTMTVSNTYPVRLFYGVSVKDAVIDALNDPQDANHDVVLAQASADGKTIDFYSNNFVKDADEGSTEASFTPSDGNKFYYYPVNTQLFIDKDCSEPATRNNIGQHDTLYYQDSHWELTGTGDEAKEVTTTGSITRSGNDWNVTYRDGNVYIAADTPRADRPATLVSNKSDNTTDTASTVLTPTWVGNSVSQKLGNNGKLSVDAPGDLRINKTVNWGNASSETQADKNSFKFTVHLYTVAEDGTQTNLTNQYDYSVYATGETPVSTGTISDNGEITLAGGQYVVISDLPNGAQYTVTEQAASQNGFTTTDNSTGENAKTDDGTVEGTIVGGDQQIASFTNTYHATEVTLEGANQLVKVKKNLTGREWQDTDEFRFTMKAEGNAPAPESADPVVVDDEDAAADYTVNLSNITFENAGTFTYVIEEDNDTEPIAGIDYSNETYAVTITVVDDGEGALKIDSVQFEQRADIDGNEPAEQPQITDNTVVFTNNYDATEATTNLNGTKDYTDNSGTNPNAAGKFTFELKAIGGYETNGGSAQNPTIGAADVPMPAGADAITHTITIGNTGTTPDGFAFQTIKYNGTHLNNTYIYEIREVIPQGATQNENGTWSLNGMTYDGTVYTVTVAITDKPNEQGEGMHIVATPDMQPTDVEFTNVYDPTDYTLTGDEAIHGTKVLQGREIGDNETFYFQLTQTGGPETVLADPEVKTVTKDSGMDFAFSELIFPKAGEYTFTVNEVADDQGTETTDGKGMTYSQNVAKVTIKVKDGGNGALVLDGPVVYENQGSDETGKAVFTNVYEASLNYGAQGAGGINVTKQLLDRPMTAGEFNFTITGEGEAADLTAEADKNFQNTGAAVDQTITMAKLQSLTFDETDAGKTYTFIVDETEPAEGDGLAGVTYDKSQYKVEIEVVDNGNGNMHAVTTVTQTMDKDGNEIADGGKVVVDHANSDDADYAVPTFGFVNDYNPNPVDMGEDTDNALQVTKKVIGAPSAADYTFTLTAQNTTAGPVANIKGLDENHQATVTTSGTIEAGGTQTLTFDTLTFTEPGTYTFTVQENEPAADDGWTFDTNARTITVEVTDVNPDYEPGGEAPQYDGNLYIGNVTGNNPTIVNSYNYGTATVEGSATTFAGTKTIDGRDWLNNETFGFELTKGEVSEGASWDKVAYLAVDAAEGTEAVPFASAQAIANAGNDGNGSFWFAGKYLFSEPGTYTFNVTEAQHNGANLPNDDTNGMNYDRHVGTITVEVTDDGSGTLQTKITYGTDDTGNGGNNTSVNFVNSYAATGEVSIEATKTLSGRNLLEGEFTFEVKDAKGSVVAEGKNAGADEGVAAAIDFGKIFYNSNDLDVLAEEEGSGVTKKVDPTTGLATYTITYTVSEKADDLPESVTTVGTTSYDVTVTVKDNGDGTMDASVDYGEAAAPLQFKNSYDETEQSAEGSKLNIVGEKVLESGMTGVDAPDLQGGEFSFTLKPSASNPNAPMPDDAVDGTKTVTNNADGSIDFGTIDYTLENTWGVTPLADALAASGEERVQTFTYEVTENVPAEEEKMEGVTYDTGTKTFTVTVKDDGAGNITVTTDPEQAPLFTVTNVYTPEDVEIGGDGQAQLQVTKEVTGAPALSEFDFVLTLTSGDASSVLVGAGEDATAFPAKGIEVSTSGLEDKQDSKTLSFGAMTFTKAGTYTFEVKETTDKPASAIGWDYDNDPKVITVTVTDTDGDGKLEIAEGAIKGNNPIIENTYTPASVTVGDDETALQVTKKVTGGNALSEFDFKLTFDDKNSTGKLEDIEGITADGIVKSTTSLKDTQGEQAVSFGELTFKKVGVYKFTVEETTAEPTDVRGWTYDNAAKTITVTVTDDGFDGQLDATTVVDGVDTNNPTVENVYSPDASDPDAAVISVIKKVSGAPALSEFEFELMLTSDNAANVFVGSGDAAAVFPADGLKASTDGLEGTEGSDTVSFDGLTFTAADTYTFTVTELTKSPGGGWTYDNDAKSITVTVEDQAGKLVVTSVVPATTTIENTYTPASVTVGGDEALKVTKKVTGGNALSEFDFVLAFDADAEGNTGKLENIEGLDQDGTVTVSTSGLEGTQGEQTVNFGDLTFSAAGDYYFTVTETTTTDDPNWAYDNAPKTIVVHVTDVDHNGQLEATVEFNNPIVENVYDEPYVPPTPDPDPDPSDPSKPDIDVDKKLDGRDIVAGEFCFKIAATGDNADYVTPKALTGTVDASGNVSFSGKGFVFDKTGEYEFTVSEVLPGDDDPETPGVQHNGVTYDETTYTITAKVTKGTGNKLVVSWDLGAAAAGVTFHNTYEPDETAKVTVNATKVLIGRDLAAGEFTFELVDAQGNVVGTATNNADGSVSFSPLEFTEAGTYTYTLREVTGGLANVTYDTTVHTVTITVVDNGDGTLTATVTYDSGSGAAPVFTNTYKVPDQPGKPEEPSEPERPDTPKIPDAGDHTNVALPAFLAVGGAALIACACLLRLRKSR